MKALSIRQPWAELILNHGKDIENRTWNTKHRGEFLIHASKKIDKVAYKEFIEKGYKLPPIYLLKTGGIVGKVNLVDCVEKSNSKWYQGEKGFVLKNPERLEFKECNGQLNFFTPKFEAA